MDPTDLDPERERLRAAIGNDNPWRLWGTYLSERQWGTVREDYSADGSAWEFFPHDHARSRAYRWGEDGLLGITDLQGRLCFAVALWNEADPILKERLFGLSGPEGNHGEDVKEAYFYLDATPTHSYAKALYKYPQRAFPYTELVEENRRRGREQREFKLVDTGVFQDDRYFDLLVEYAKASPTDIVIRFTATNRGPESAPLHLLPSLWFRNTWSWDPGQPRPRLSRASDGVVQAEHATLGTYWLACEEGATLLFTENESNTQRLWGVPNDSPYVKDGMHDWLVQGAHDRVNPSNVGTKAVAHYQLLLEPGRSRTVTLRLSAQRLSRPFDDADDILEARRSEADTFYARRELTDGLSDDARLVQRQALAGLLWSKQLYLWDVDRWLEGDTATPPPPESRCGGRNRQWRHFNTEHVLSMPDKWEYPWFAAWDLAFHALPLALVDPELAKEQLVILLREWYMHPNGQLPAYEWELGDVNPPVHAWAAWQVYQLDSRAQGRPDRQFLESVFHKLLLNFTWWVNRKDREGNNVFEGGFLGLDNIGAFDRSSALPNGGHLEQSDGTAWMGMYSLNMLQIALELARQNPVYEDVATKFLEHFLYIAAAMNTIGQTNISLWDDEDEYFYDVLHAPNSDPQRLKVRSMVGLIPLLAVETIEPDLLELLPSFKARLEWFLEHRPHLAALVSRWQEPGLGERRLLAVVRGHRMKRLLKRMLDPDELLGPFGVRSMSRHHLEHPYVLEIDGAQHVVRYEPAESSSGLFGGNSNWRGPVWFPVNFLLIDALQRFHHYYGDDFRVECPTGSGQYLTLAEVAAELTRRLTSIFLRDESGRRPVFGQTDLFQSNPHWRDYVAFYECFHGDDGSGLGASHQTGWTALVANLLRGDGPR